MDSIGAMLSEGPAVFPRSTNALVGSHLLSFDCSSDCTESPLSYERRNSNRKLRYSWAVDLGTSK